MSSTRRSREKNTTSRNQTYSNFEEYYHVTKTKIALAAALFAGTASVAMAQEFDPNLANRYPAYNGPACASTFQSAPVSLSTSQRADTAAERRRPFQQDPRGAGMQPVLPAGAALAAVSPGGGY